MFMNSSSTTWPLAALLLLAACSTPRVPVGSGTDATADDRAALDRTGDAIREAFARGDVAAVVSYHHPAVEKALGWDHYLVGREAVEADLAGTLSSHTLEFVENRRESLVVRGDLAVEQTVFAIRGTPKGEGEPFVFRGRTSVVYTRDEASPSGWAILREIIQPAVE